MENQINGVVILNKPTGMNSMTATNRVKRILNVKKAGHLGTLDPFASGVLPVAVGNATKLFEKHLKDTKTYKAIFRFGIETDTFDSAGKITATQDVNISKKQVENALKSMTGTFDQMPPAFSAKKINGVRAYDLARVGESVLLNPKTITIYQFDLICEQAKNTFLFEIKCSSGTYIRSICRDLAKALGTVGVMVALVRTQSGEFDISNSILLDEVNSEMVLKI